MATKKLKARRQRDLAKRAHRGRSDLYRHVRDSYPDLVQQNVGAREGPSWDDVAGQLASEGARDRTGKAPSGETVRKMFGRVRRDLAAEVALRATGLRPASSNRTRAPANWQPRPVATASPQVVTPPPSRPEMQAERPGLLSRIGRSLVDRSTRSVEQPAEAAPAVDPAPLALPREGGPLTPEQVEAMMADLRRTLDERSGR